MKWKTGIPLTILEIRRKKYLRRFLASLAAAELKSTSSELAPKAIHVSSGNVVSCSFKVRIDPKIK